MTPLLACEGLRKSYPRRRSLLGVVREWQPAVKDVGFTLDEGETVALVGESGAGKSTVGRLLLRVVEPDAGSVTFKGRELLTLRPRELRAQRRDMQMVFQDPYGSLDPRMSVAASVAEPLLIHTDAGRSERRRRAQELLERVGISRHEVDQYPHEFSGGQRQRIAIARAIATNPALIVCDEPVSALDVSIRAQVLNLLRDLQAERGLSYLFIAHDLSLVRAIADRVAVMYGGEIVEMGSTARVFDHPRHEYTRLLLSAVPVPDPRRRASKRDA